MTRSGRFALPLISALSLLAVVIYPGREEHRVLLIIRNFVLLSVSFSSLAIFFVKSEKFQDFLGDRPVGRVTILLLSAGVVFHVGLGFLLHGEDVTRAVEQSLDSIAYFTQARIFSAGHLNVPSHELRDFFTTGFCINDGRYYSLYFPGWPLILAGGILLGIPWAVNPLFGLLTLPVLYLTGKEIYDESTGLFAAALVLSSPIFLTLTPSYASDPTALFFSSLFFYFMVRSMKEPGVRHSAAAGLSLGMAFLIRPYSALVVSAPVLAYVAYRSLNRGKRDLETLATVAFAAVPFVLLLLIYNHFQTGSFFLTPFQKYNPLSSLGFGMRSRDIIVSPSLFTPLDGIKRAAVNLAFLNIGVVPFLFLFLLFVLLNEKSRADILLFSTLLAMIVMHVFYYDASNRHYYSSFFALFLLAARGIRLSDLSFSKFFPTVPVKNLGNFILLYIVIANMFIVFSTNNISRRIDMHKMMRDPFVVAEREKLANAVVFLKKVPERYNNATYFVQNSLDFNGDVLFVKDLKERNRELMDYYPGRMFYTYEFDSEAGAGRLTRLK